VVAYRAGKPIRVRQFLADVRRLAGTLSRASHVLNACSDRYLFSVGLAASLVSKRLSLLPPTTTPEVIAQLRRFAPDLTCLTDEDDCRIELPQLRYPPMAEAGNAEDAGEVVSGPAPDAVVPMIEAAQPTACVFTSGSTGTPLPYHKTFGSLIQSVRVEAERLGLSPHPPCTIVATVPPQHMFGFESSVLLAMANGFALCAERPFYPADIVAVLEAVPRPRLLVSTPVHLRALLASGVALPAADLLISATAPLPQPLAQDAEQRFGTRLLEIYGSTETGQIAARRPTETAEWRLWPRVRLSVSGEESWAEGGHVGQRTRLYDVLELTGPDRFLLHGRVADLVNIAGKRSSLAYLNHQLNSIPGVLDGAFFHLEEAAASHTGVERVGACVVAPGLDATRVLEALRLRIDPVFLPRPLLLVPRLPRNSTGKLPQQALRSLVAAH
jgi:acyl-coenzyme A synthetase/AMP-(fatty) acid ligase